MDTLIHTFCSKQREFLQLELLQSQDDNDNEQQQQNVLHGLHVHDVSVGLYGKTLVQLTRQTTTEPVLLPAHRFTTGDQVELQSSRRGATNHPPRSSSSSTMTTGGIIHQVTDTMITVALFGNTSHTKKTTTNNDEEDDEDDVLGTPPLTLLPKSSIEVHKKLIAALDELEMHGINHPVAGTIIERVFQVPPSSDDDTVLSPTVPSSSSSFQDHHQEQSSLLDDSQKEAIQMALSSQQPVALLHGPPGSGKTTTIVELIRQAVGQHGYRVLVTAPSHVAVDQILSRLVNNNSSTNKKDNNKKQQQLRVVRLGHPARLQADILPYSLEAMVQAADGTEIVQDVRQELQMWLRRLHSKHKWKYADKVTARREIKLLRHEIRQREQKVVHELLHRAQVVLATCVGAANRLLSMAKNNNGGDDDSPPFDLVIVDEAAQSLEAACWIPLLRGSRLVLAGDHCQLPPTIQCKDPRVQQGLGHTMFARIMKLYEENPARISRMLKVQYRMHETIANWASEALYHGELTTHASAQGRTLATLPGVVVSPNTDNDDDSDDDLAHMPLLLIDTAGCDCYESTNAAGSRFNRGEAHIVQQHVQKLLDMGVPASQIAVITPYNGQVEFLKLMEIMPDGVEIRTVDGFQGGEREAVVLSLVRSSPPQKGLSSIGFLRDDRRLNVAVTRAKRHCCVVADSETVSTSPFVKNLIEWIEQHGEQRSAWDYMLDDTHAQMDQDLIQAQLELEQYLRSNDTSQQKDGIAKKKDAAVGATASAEREALLERVRAFYRTSKAGDELVLNKELSKGDRHAVHELAEELGILHISSGTEGLDRQMTLSIPLPESSSNDGALPGITESMDKNIVNADTNDNVEETDHDELNASSIPAFHILRDEEEESSSVSEVEAEMTIATSVKIAAPLNPMAVLAKEREQRERERRAQQSKNSSAPVTENKAGKKKETEQKVGVSSSRSKQQHKGDKKKTDETVIEDDMAFLDAEINKVQNSHGRTVFGKGTNYRSIVNGILLARPNPIEKKANPRATSALQAKLKEAENSRKAKAKPKKK